MKLHTLYIAVLFFMTTVSTATAAIPSFGKEAGEKTHVKSLKIERSENNLFVSIQLDLVSLKFKSDREITYIPVFKPSYVFITPAAESVKTREVRESASCASWE